MISTLLFLNELPEIPTLLQLTFTTSAAAVLLINAIPPFARRFIPYGKVAETSTSKPTPNSTSTSSSPKPTNLISTFLDRLATLTVPHSYFSHFYLLGVILSLFWAYQITTHGRLYLLLRSHSPAGGMSIQQVILTHLCFLTQVSRRLYECLYIQKPGTSRMWFVHYLLGLTFYGLMSMAVWIEGFAAIDEFTKWNYWTLRSLLGPPSLKSWLGLMPIFFAWGVQHDAHVHLAELRKYSLPTHPLFAKLVCPHYLAEVVIYASMMVVGAPEGKILNLTIWSGLVFVVCNLGVSAGMQRKWYEGKFGKEKMAGKWNMIVGIY